MTLSTRNVFNLNTVKQLLMYISTFIYTPSGVEIEKYKSIWFTKNYCYPIVHCPIPDICPVNISVKLFANF